jgi:hypothetical protein
LPYQFHVLINRLYRLDEIDFISGNVLASEQCDIFIVYAIGQIFSGLTILEKHEIELQAHKKQYMEELKVFTAWPSSGQKKKVSTW